MDPHVARSSCHCDVFGCGRGAWADATLAVATVNNVQVIGMQKLAPGFERQHPDVHLRWVALEKNTLRRRVTTDIATKGGQFERRFAVWAPSKEHARLVARTGGC